MRSKKAPRRIITPDPIYGSRLLQKFINYVMIDGKKSIAQRLVYGALDQIKEESNQDPLKVFETAITNVIAVSKTFKGSSNYECFPENGS